MIPIVKGWCTETAQEVASLGIQVHGGMGFIEETGAAQHYRDARIITIKSSLVKAVAAAINAERRIPASRSS